MANWQPPAAAPLAPPFRGIDRAAALQAASGCLLTGEDALQIDGIPLLGGEALTVSGVMLTDGLELRPFSFQASLANQRAVNTTKFPLGAGWLLHVRAVLQSTTNNGRVFAFVRIVRGTDTTTLVLATLASGYCSLNGDVYWPGGVVQAQSDGGGLITFDSNGAPAAGADWSVNPPSAVRTELIAVTAQLVTSAAVANRSPRLVIKDGGGVNLVVVPASATIPASQTVQCCWAAGAGGPITSDAAFGLLAPLPNGLVVTPTLTVGTSTGLIQAADQWSNIRLTWKEWAEL